VPERAAVGFHIEFDGAEATPFVGEADGSTWKVSRNTVCAVVEHYFVGDTAMSCPA
jgi:hypothetical protein